MADSGETIQQLPGRLARDASHRPICATVRSVDCLVGGSAIKATPFPIS